MKISFHGFTSQERIGAGGMSTVYKGAHAVLGYPVAIKLLHLELSEDPRFIARFEREARVASIRNSNIASVIDFGKSDDRYFIVMEYVDGRNFRALMDEMVSGSQQNRALPVEVVLALIESVAIGLKAAHDCDVVHRDIKPSNLMLGYDGEVKVVDFGLARDFNDISDVTKTQPGTILGTAPYMSPEQARGETNLGPQSDIFSLGITCFEMLTGEKPFKGDSLSEIQSRITRSAAPRLTPGSCPLLTGEIADFVGRMLAHNVEKRFQTMDQVLRAIDICWESIDIIGFRKNRRANLAQFARDPSAFSQELRQKDIKAYLNRGSNFETMGLEKIDDAISAFEMVLSVDPDNRKAGNAISQLKKRRVEQQRESLFSRAWTAIKKSTRRERYLTAAIAIIAAAIVAVFVWNPRTMRPGFSPEPGSYATPQAVEITCGTDGATIRYTTDGSDPSASPSVYSTPINVSSTTTVKAVATANRHKPSQVTLAVYTIETPLPTPTFSPAPGSFSPPQVVTIKCDVEGVTIWYTTDGSEPTASSQPYGGPITISKTTTLKARAVKSGYQPSEIAWGMYTPDSVLPAPTFSLAAGSYELPQTVTITCGTEGATIRYTTNGRDPISSSSVYHNPITVSAPMTLKARTEKVGYHTSPVVSAMYRAENVVATPTFDPDPGTYTLPQSVTIRCATAGATIYYTTDGSEPSASSPIYEVPITVSTTTLLKAMAKKTGYIQSEIAPGRYRFVTANQPRDLVVRFELTAPYLVIVDGSDGEVRSGAVTLPMTSGMSHTLVIRDPNGFRCERRRDVDLAADRDLDLGALDPACGSLTVAANENVSLLLDGEMLAASTKKLANLTVGAGEHTLAVACPGRQVVKATYYPGTTELPRREERAGYQQFTLVVEDNDDLEIFVMVK